MGDVIVLSILKPLCRAINPPTLDMYDDFVIAAKNFSPIATVREI